jgi:23S rRNA pseudouridine1911/1915/1917 synthase
MSGADAVAVDVRGARQRLDRYLAAVGRWGTRSQVQRLIAAGAVRLDGQPAKAGTLLRRGQTIEVETPPPATPARVEAEAIALDVIYEDDWLLVINKPAGLVVHPAPGHWSGTLVSALLHHWKGGRPGLDAMRPGIVHRLDKDTSGVLVIAKDAATLEALGAQFRARAVEKQYVAFVWGRPRAPRGIIAEPIGRNPLHRKKMAVRRSGRPALTTYEVCESGGGITMLRLFPKTGRTHQLRVHLAAIGHPIVGDRAYGRGGAAVIGRQALHAERISFRHPRTGARVTFTAPLAPDLAELRRRGAHGASLA